MKCDRQNFLSFWTIFLPFYSPNNLKNQNFKKLKKMPGDIIILHMCIHVYACAHFVQDQISKHFATISNLSFFTGIFPTNLKTAKVIPIHKKDSKLEVSNYRPISLLSTIDRIFEKLTHSRLIEFF